MKDTLLDHPLLTSRYFYPWPNRFDDPFFVDGNGFRLGCRFMKISENLPTIFHFHGNGETVSDYLGDFEEWIADIGANLLLAEFRGYGMSTGEPALAAMLDDVQLVVDTCGVPPEQIIFFGRSLGALYALHGAGLYPDAAGLVIESGLADPLERILVRVKPADLGGTLEELQQSVSCHLNQQAKISAFNGQVLIMHTRHDDLVSVSHAERLYDWANQPKELLIFERGDHNTILAVNQEAYFSTLERFITNIRRSNT